MDKCISYDQIGKNKTRSSDLFLGKLVTFSGFKALKTSTNYLKGGEGEQRGRLEGSGVCAARSKLALGFRQRFRLLRVHVSFSAAAGKGSDFKGRKRGDTSFCPMLAATRDLAGRRRPEKSPAKRVW